MRRRKAVTLSIAALGLLILISAFIPADVPSGVYPVPGLILAPDTTVVTGPLNKFGFPDYVTVVDDLVAEGVKPEENFWALFDETLAVSDGAKIYLAELKKRPGFERAGTTPFLELSKAVPNEYFRMRDELDRLATTRWRRSDSPRIADWLDGCRDALEIIVTASSRPKAYAPILAFDDDRMLMSVLLPHEEQARQVAKALVARSTLALSDKRYDEAWRDLLATHRIGYHHFSGAFFMDHLVGSAIASIAVTPTTLAIADEPGDASIVQKRWKASAEALRLNNRFQRALHAERLGTVQAHLALMAGMDMGFENRATAKADKTSLLEATAFRLKRRFQQMTIGDANQALRYTNGFWDRLEEALATSGYAEQSAAVEHVCEEYFGKDYRTVGEPPLTRENFWERIAVQKLSPAIEPHLRGTARTRQWRVLLHAAFVAELYYRQKGRDIDNGEQLQELAPGYAAAAGVDCPPLHDSFANRPLRVRKIDGILSIYSTGPDRRDDEGVTDEVHPSDDLICRLIREDELRPPPPPVAEDLLEDDLEDELDVDIEDEAER